MHYAARQIQRQRAKHKEADFLMPSQSYHRGSDYYRSTGAGSIRPFASEYTSEDAAPGRSALRPERSGENSGAAGQHSRSNDSGAERRSSRAGQGGSGAISSDARGFSIQEDAVIGMPSVVNMLTETLNRADDRPSSCFGRFLRRPRTTNEEHEELAEVFGSSLAAQGALRARTWHRCGRCCAYCLTRADLIHYVWHRWAGLIDWLARCSFPPAFGCYYIYKMASVDALCVLRFLHLPRHEPWEVLKSPLDTVTLHLHVLHRWISLGLVETGDIVVKLAFGCTVLMALCACPGCVEGCRTGCRDVCHIFRGRT